MEIRTTTAVATPGSSTNKIRGQYRLIPILLGAIIAVAAVVVVVMVVL